MMVCRRRGGDLCTAVLRNKAYRSPKQTSGRCTVGESQSFRWHDCSLRYSTLVVEVSEDEDDDDGDGERLHYDDASRCARYNIVSTLQLASGRVLVDHAHPRNSVSQSRLGQLQPLLRLVWLCGSTPLYF